MKKVISSTHVPKSLEPIEKKELDPLFSKKEIQILFLKNDKESYVEAYESNTLPCTEIIEHLNRGKSVFSSNKPLIQREPRVQKKIDNPNESLYLTRV